MARPAAAAQLLLPQLLAGLGDEGLRHPLLFRRINRRHQLVYVPCTHTSRSYELLTSLAYIRGYVSRTCYATRMCMSTAHTTSGKSNPRGERLAPDTVASRSADAAACRSCEGAGVYTVSRGAPRSSVTTRWRDISRSAAAAAAAAASIRFHCTSVDMGLPCGIFQKTSFQPCARQLDSIPFHKCHDRNHHEDGKGQSLNLLDSHACIIKQTCSVQTAHLVVGPQLLSGSHISGQLAISTLLAPCRMCIREQTVRPSCSVLHSHASLVGLSFRHLQADNIKLIWCRP